MAAAGRVAPRTARPRSPTADVLALQRQVGNRALATVLTAQREPDRGSGEPGPAPGADLVDEAARVLPPSAAGAVGAQLVGVVGALGLTGTMLSMLVAGGHRDANALTNMAFWAAHPDLFGTRLLPSQPGFGALAAEWTALRRGLVTEALKAPASTAASTAAGPAASPTTGTATGPAAGATAGATTGTATATAPAGTDATFVADQLRSTVDRLPEPERSRFAAIRWGWADYPGSQYPLASLRPDEVESYRQDAALTFDERKQAFVGTHQQDALALFAALARRRPGGGERRVNLGGTALITAEQFRAAPDRAAVDAYIVGQIDQNQVPGGRATLNKHAAAAFRRMADAARADGVPLRVLSGYRSRASEERTARTATNRYAFGGFSPHSLGLAADIALKVGTSARADFDETSTRMDKLVGILNSPAYKWVYMNGATYGFYQYRAEPWHWEYNPDGFREQFWSEADEAIRQQPFAQPPAAAPATR